MASFSRGSATVRASFQPLVAAPLSRAGRPPSLLGLLRQRTRRPAAVPSFFSSSAAAGAKVGAAALAGAPRTFAEQLARRSAPTLLYEAPPHFWFRVGCLLSGGCCFAYTAANYWNVYLRPPPDLAWWVPHAFGGICLFMTGVGTYFLRSGARIVRTVHAVPVTRLAQLAGRGLAAKAARANGVPNVSEAALQGRALPVPVFLEITIGRILPLLPARKLYVAPASLALPFRLAMTSADAPGTTRAGSAATGYERVLARRAAEERAKQAREYEMNHLMTAPFRHAWQGAGVAVRSMQRAVTRDGFAKVEIEGRAYKLDMTGGWALESGRALDRLATIKEGQMSIH